MDVDAVVEAARQLRRLGDDLRDLDHELQTKVRQPLRADWQGPAADAADERLRLTGKEAFTQLDLLATGEDHLLRFADGLTEAQALVKQAESLARRAGLHLETDGSVAFPDGWFFSSDADREPMTKAAGEVAKLLQKAVDVASQADASCAQGLTPGPLLQFWQGASGGDGFWDRAGDTVAGWFEVDFDSTPLGEAWNDFTEGDREWYERVFVDPDGQLDIFGDMNEGDAAMVDEVIGGSPDEIFGEEVVDRVHDEGLASLPDAMWDDFYEGVTDIDDKISDGWNDFTDDPVGSLGRAFGIG
ncbi:WXG100 family type VII secretion target [Rhizocola hellebori]|uniref:WXG100 family type VII secretion target n=1 Tax=Rhizocola hellebori TaxID=1392758 RepID=UPI0019421964|nr:WXG100 family type VII secretion target [Rhizocola hellebori]